MKCCIVCIMRLSITSKVMSKAFIAKIEIDPHKTALVNR